MVVHNPVLKGFYPDPSVCEANGKFYMCNSTFHYLPGAPVFESDDLINWKQVANALTDSKQIDLHKVNSSGGMFAPTIRYNNGRFYMVTCNNSTEQNFYVYTDDLNGKWSDPIFVDQGGIDPSLLFDEDGTVYFTSNGQDEEGAVIMQCTIDIETGRKLSESKPLWRGSGGRYIESPHLYHIGEWYYLMVAEGGTEYGHMITYARSKSPFGPFEGYAFNPVLTNRNVGGNVCIIQGIGHGDLVKDKNGNYFILCLGFRQTGIWYPFHHLGREVYLAPVTFTDDGWFTAGINGTVKENMEMNIQAEQIRKGNYDFSFAASNPLNDLHFMYLRDYDKNNYSFDEKSRTLTLRGTDLNLNDMDTPTFIGVRQSEFNIEASVSVYGEATEAGITVYMDESQHYDLYRYNDYSALPDEQIKIGLRVKIGDAEEIKDEVFLPYGTRADIRITSDADEYRFYALLDGEETLLGKARSKYLSSEVAGGFTGTLVALYATEGEAKFESFVLNQFER